MKNNNGKIAIAIVAMFVVALSIVGFTYAYFTAQVVGNDNSETSVTVEAGKLEITYDYGRSIEAGIIVPGWISDDDKFYDPVHSINADNEITSVSDAELTEDGKTASAGAQETVKPAVFSITNTGTRDAAYKVSLVDIINNISSTAELDDKENLRFKVEAARGLAPNLDKDTVTYTDITSTLGFETNLGENDKRNGTIKLNNTDTEQVDTDQVLFEQTVARNQADYYRITLYYFEAEEDQSASANLNSNNAAEDKKVAVSLTVQVDGLGQNKVTTTTAQSSEN